MKILEKLTNEIIENLSIEQRDYNVTDKELQKYKAWVCVTKKGRKIFRLRYRFEGEIKRNGSMFTIGNFNGYNPITLEKAMLKCKQVLFVVDQGCDPHFSYRLIDNIDGIPKE